MHWSIILWTTYTCSGIILWSSWLNESLNTVEVWDWLFISPCTAASSCSDSFITFCEGQTQSRRQGAIPVPISLSCISILKAHRVSQTHHQFPSHWGNYIYCQLWTALVSYVEYTTRWPCKQSQVLASWSSLSGGPLTPGCRKLQLAPSLHAPVRKCRHSERKKHTCIHLYMYIKHSSNDEMTLFLFLRWNIELECCLIFIFKSLLYKFGNVYRK